MIGLVITIWVYYFFRDPERFPIQDENYLVSPADGKITQIMEMNGPKELGLDEKKSEGNQRDASKPLTLEDLTNPDK